MSGLSRLSGSLCSQGRPLAWAAGHWTRAGHLVAPVLGWLHPALFSTGSLDTGCAQGCDLSLTCRGSWGLWAQTAQGDLGLWRPETLGVQTPVCVQAFTQGLAHGEPQTSMAVTGALFTKMRLRAPGAGSPAHSTTGSVVGLSASNHGLFIGRISAVTERGQTKAGPQPQ